jgi:2,5-diamino-6-(ribosylamino)-4(3H)-pyrimidinone 5'-phosphate reductase
MNKPYIVCYMVMSLDGRIDCPMTEHLKGAVDYYPVLESLNCPFRISGRVTAEKEMAKPGRFEAQSGKRIGKTSFKKNTDSSNYDVICDSKGSLLWGKENETPLLIITSEDASEEYLDYLDGLGISWIAAGEKRIDLVKAMEILCSSFGAERAAVVGGGNINAAFLDAGLLDEIDIIVGAGVDGRASRVSVFDGLGDETPLHGLSLKKARVLPSGGVLLSYEVLN